MQEAHAKTTTRTSPEHSRTETAKEEPKLVFGAVQSRYSDIFVNRTQIGEGMYGAVFRAWDPTRGEWVAMKRIHRHDKNGFPLTATREIKLLKKLKHENIVELKEIVSTKANDENKGHGDIFLVFEYCDFDMNGLQQHLAKLKSDGILKKANETELMQSPFTLSQVKYLSRGLLQAIKFLHENDVLHRDIKGSNLLIDKNGGIKLADFGLARPQLEINPRRPMNYTNKVITLWYRPPELLLKGVSPDIIGKSIDVWSAGCIIAELLIGRALFPGQNELDELDKIFDICGLPTKGMWPKLGSLPLWKEVSEHPKNQLPRQRHFRSFFRKFHVGEDAIDLLERMLDYDPDKRITAHAALDFPFFRNVDVGTDRSCMMELARAVPDSCHEYEERIRRKEREKRLRGETVDQKERREPSKTEEPEIGTRSRNAPGGDRGGHGRGRTELIWQNDRRDVPQVPRSSGSFGGRERSFGSQRRGGSSNQADSWPGRPSDGYSRGGSAPYRGSSRGGVDRRDVVFRGASRGGMDRRGTSYGGSSGSSRSPPPYSSYGRDRQLPGQQRGYQDQGQNSSMSRDSRTDDRYGRDGHREDRDGRPR